MKRKLASWGIGFSLITFFCVPEIIHATVNHDVPFVPDHYLSYDVHTVSLHRHHISLKDRFIDWTDFVVQKPFKLLNPTVKRHNGAVYDIRDPKLHYAAYELDFDQDLFVDEKVLVINQFGQFEIDAFKVNHILVPTHKKELAAAFDDKLSDAHHRDQADHYLCYEIPPVELDLQSGFLKDQFRSRSFGKMTARHFCNPVAKKHNDRVFDIVHNDSTNHIMCFEIERESIWKAVELINQFGEKKVLVTHDDELCVPSASINIPRECSQGQPSDGGMCNGYCDDPTLTCLPDTSGGGCYCGIPYDTCSLGN